MKGRLATCSKYMTARPEIRCKLDVTCSRNTTRSHPCTLCRRSKLQLRGWKVVVTGHSLGAAVATLLGMQLRERFAGELLAALGRAVLFVAGGLSGACDAHATLCLDSQCSECVLNCLVHLQSCGAGPSTRPAAC